MHTFSQRPKANPYSQPQRCPGQSSLFDFSSEEPVANTWDMVSTDQVLPVWWQLVRQDWNCKRYPQLLKYFQHYATDLMCCWSYNKSNFLSAQLCLVQYVSSSVCASSLLVTLKCVCLNLSDCKVRMNMIRQETVTMKLNAADETSYVPPCAH